MQTATIKKLTPKQKLIAKLEKAGGVNANRKAFRVSKTDLKVRPIYHRLPRRIEAHICLTFVAYKVYKELERQLQILKAPIKAKKAIEIAESIFQITVQLPQSKQIIKHNLILNEEQKLLQSIFKF